MSMEDNWYKVTTYTDKSEAFYKARSEFARIVCDYYGRECREKCPFFDTQICNNTAGITRTRFEKTTAAFIEYLQNGTPIPEKYLKKNKGASNGTKKEKKD